MRLDTIRLSPYEQQLEFRGRKSAIDMIEQGYSYIWNTRAWRTSPRRVFRRSSTWVEAMAPLTPTPTPYVDDKIGKNAPTTKLGRSKTFLLMLKQAAQGTLDPSGRLTTTFATMLWLVFSKAWLANLCKQTRRYQVSVMEMRRAEFAVAPTHFSQYSSVESLSQNS